MAIRFVRWSMVMLLVFGAAGLTACGGGSSSDSDSSSSDSAPTISTEPSSVSVAVGSSATFSVTASGGTLSYQWYKAGSAISSATSSSYTISSVTSDDAGSYYVVVTNSYGSTTSSTATLTVSDSTASCDTTYIDEVLTAIDTFESAIGSSLTATTQYDTSSYTTSQLNVYRTDWSNLPNTSYSRPGITLGDLSSSTQIEAFNTLAQTVLGDAGYEDFEGVLAADDYLGYTKNSNGYGAENYHVAFIGTPSETGMWTLMLGGHHMAYNITFNGGCAYPTPHHIGVEPRTSFSSNDHYASAYGTAVYDSGTYKVLDSKASAMVAIFSNLGSTLLKSAFLSGETFSDVLIGPVEGGTGSYSEVSSEFSAVEDSSERGVLVSELSTAQQAYVTAAIEQFVDDYDDTTAARLLEDYEDGYDSTYIAWANSSGTYSSSGPDVTSNETYMRIDGPRVWIEIACQNGVIISNQTHYHMMFRDKTYDYYNELSSD
ncbi:DUF3500 domain-containing protein [Solimonas marina]|uniref:DUF3500 domain-containing protein n=1 Tax=Solimonas marina TaxID=2714601 RepID=A0A969W9T1_9GAMM|nr:DUF3500 domain-containing protein [Solimonas marina]NKF22098.1 DUF3500 domain-containing protein [Solimonas marina]